VDYCASHFALMTVYAVLFLLIAKAQFVDGTGISPDLMLLLAAPLIVRIGLAIGRTTGGRRLGLAIGFTMGGIWALAGLALLASAQKAAAGPIDEFADLRPAAPRLEGGS
jgi:hypothetical protein